MNRYKTTAQDWFNQIAHNLTSNALIQFVLKTEANIDYQILKQSVLLLLEAEPILSCLFIEEETRPEWQQTQIDIDDICYLQTTDMLEAAIDCALSRTLDVAKQVPIQVFLIKGQREEEQKHNAIVIKISHAACDGSGAKYLVRELASIYTRLEQEPSFVPRASIMLRDTHNFFKVLQISDKAGYFKEEKAELTSTWGFPPGKKAGEAQSFSCRQLHYHEGALHGLMDFARGQEVTVNSLLMAAYYSALRHCLNPPEGTKELQFMMDLRTCFPAKASCPPQRVCNLSAILNADLPEETTDFAALVRKTNRAVRKSIQDESFIHSTIAGDLAEEAGYGAVKDFINADWQSIQQSGRCTPMLSNLGIFSPEAIFFGKAEVSNLCCVTPAFFAPAFMLGAMTYSNTLTINASYYSPGIDGHMVQELLQHMDSRLKAISP